MAKPSVTSPPSLEQPRSIGRYRRRGCLRPFRIIADRAHQRNLFRLGASHHQIEMKVDVAMPPSIECQQRNLDPAGALQQR
jgi:hypothetical protein